MKAQELATQLYEGARGLGTPSLASLAMVPASLGLVAPGAAVANLSHAPATITPTPDLIDQQGGAAVPENPAATPLEDVSQLPGFRLHTNKQQSTSVTEATVTIMQRTVMDGGSSSGWVTDCSGEKVTTPTGSLDVLTTFTCVAAGVYSNPSLFEGFNQTGGVDSNSPPDNGVIQYAIKDALSSSPNSGNAPIALVDGITVDQATGSALLHTTTPNPEDLPFAATTERSFTEIPALPLSALAPYRKPAVGEPVVFGSLTEPNGKHVSRPAGRFVGTYAMTAADNQNIDGPVRIVGVNPPSRKQDMCNDFSNGVGAEGTDAKLLGVIEGGVSDNEQLMSEIQQQLGVQLVGRYSELCIVDPTPAQIVAPTSSAVAASLKK